MIHLSSSESTFKIKMPVKGRIFQKGSSTNQATYILEMYTMLVSNSGLPGIFCLSSLFQNRNNSTPSPSWFGQKFYSKPDSFLTSHKCSPKLEESNHGLCNTAMSHQMEPLGSISSISEGLTVTLAQRFYLCCVSTQNTFSSLQLVNDTYLSDFQSQQ